MICDRTPLLTHASAILLGKNCTNGIGEDYISRRKKKIPRDIGGIVQCKRSKRFDRPVWDWRTRLDRRCYSMATCKLRRHLYVPRRHTRGVYLRKDDGLTRVWMLLISTPGTITIHNELIYLVFSRLFCSIVVVGWKQFSYTSRANCFPTAVVRALRCMKTESKAWVGVVKKTGILITGHCTCMAG